jgi:arabinogalactan oligomer/maltooligosaccharide transport system permease protein
MSSVVQPRQPQLEELRRRARNRRRLALNAKRVVIVLIIVLVLAPGYFIVLASLSPGSSFFAGSLLPKHLTIANYRTLLFDSPFPTWVKNSVIVCTAVSTISTVCVGLMAYAFARLRFVGRRHGLFGLLIVQMFPISVAVPAYYFFLLKLSGWTNNHIGLETYGGLILLLTGSGMAFYAWLFKGYLDNSPIELEEAAFVDGATRLQVLRYVVLPIVRPMVAVVFLLVFIATYSEYLISSIVITATQSRYTLPLGLRGFIFNRFTENWSEFAAAAVIGSLPLMFVFLLTQRYLVSGLARGAVKG